MSSADAEYAHFIHCYNDRMTECQLIFWWREGTLIVESRIVRSAKSLKYCYCKKSEACGLIQQSPEAGLAADPFTLRAAEAGSKGSLPLQTHSLSL